MTQQLLTTIISDFDKLDLNPYQCDSFIDEVTALVNNKKTKFYMDELRKTFNIPEDFPLLLRVSEAFYYHNRRGHPDILHLIPDSSATKVIAKKAYSPGDILHLQLDEGEDGPEVRIKFDDDKTITNIEYMPDDSDFTYSYVKHGENSYGEHCGRHETENTIDHCYDEPMQCRIKSDIDEVRKLANLVGLDHQLST